MPIIIASIRLRGDGLRIIQENRRKHAFTLVELMVVVLILGALAFVAIPRIGQSVDNAKKRACEANIYMINQAIDKYYLANGVFPATQMVVKRDKNYFPDGPPLCPVTGRVYRGMTANNRVDTSEHNH
jgi:prepilin-type N-terminal cleavage/methylation domain-containing protein